MLDYQIQFFDPFQSLRLQIETVQNMFRNVINPCIEIGNRLCNVVGVVDENPAIRGHGSLDQRNTSVALVRPPIIQVNQLQVPENRAGIIVVGERQLKSIVATSIDEYFKSKAKIDLLNTSSAGSVLQLPATTQWNQVTIRLDEPTLVTFLLNEKEVGQLTDEDLGFHRHAGKQQTLEWRFLLGLSVYFIESNKKGVPTIAEMQHMLKVSTPQACQRLKFNLSRKLKVALGIQDDPFYSYREKGFYLPKFTLQSLPELRGNGELFIQGIMYDEGRGYQSPIKKKRKVINTDF